MLEQKVKPPVKLLRPRIVLRGGQVTLVDQDTVEKYSRYVWFLRKSNATWYVVRKTQVNGHTRYIRLHREITGCPHGLEVHHVNRNPLDNRLCNLLVCTPQIHHAFHRKNFMKFA